MGKLNIWLIQTGEPFPFEENVKKMRTGLLADKLVERGHSVLWWTTAFDHFKKSWISPNDVELELKKNLKIFTLKGKGYKKNISLSRLIDHRTVVRKFRKFSLEKPKPDIIVASMPPHDLACEAVKYAKKKGIPVLVDIRDPWPDIFLKHVPNILHIPLRTLLYKDFNMTKVAMRAADGLLAVTNPFLEWGLRYAKREKTVKDKVYCLGHKKHNLSNDSEIMNKFSKIKGVLLSKFIVFFVGTISKSYHNPLILLKAAEELKEIENIHFVISGDGELLKELKKDSSGLTNVTVTGWLNQDEIEFFLQHSKVGICPATKVLDLPTNKAYAYISAGLPVVSAFNGELKEIIERNKIGFYYPPNDVNQLVASIRNLYEDAELYTKMSQNARQVFRDMFDAEMIYEEYAQHIEKIAQNYVKDKK